MQGGITPRRAIDDIDTEGSHNLNKAKGVVEGPTVVDPFRARQPTNREGSASLRRRARGRAGQVWGGEDSVRDTVR